MLSRFPGPFEILQTCVRLEKSRRFVVKGMHGQSAISLKTLQINAYFSAIVSTFHLEPSNWKPIIVPTKRREISVTGNWSVSWLDKQIDTLLWLARASCAMFRSQVNQLSERENVSYSFLYKLTDNVVYSKPFQCYEVNSFKPITKHLLIIVADLYGGLFLLFLIS